MLDQIAIISDVHGNLPALDAVLADIGERGIETIYCLGDLVGKGPQSAETLDLQRAVCDVVIRGNWDETVGARPQRSNIIFQWQRDRLSAAQLAYLAQLPYSYDLCLSGKRVRLVHATPQSVYTKLPPRSDYALLLALFEATSLTGEDAPTPDIVMHGHNHQAHQYALAPDHKLVVNVGSVGNPTDLPLAAYTILEGKRDCPQLATFNVQHVRVPYDIEAAVAAAQATDLPGKEFYIVELRTAVYRGLQPDFVAQREARRLRTMTSWQRARYGLQQRLKARWGS